MAVDTVGTAVIKMNAAGLREVFGIFQQFDPGKVRHANVGNDQVVDLRFNLGQGRLAAGDRFHRMPVLAEGDLQHLAERFFVIHNE